MHGRLHAAKSVLNSGWRLSSRECWDRGVQPLVQSLRSGLAAHDSLQLCLHQEIPVGFQIRRMILPSSRRQRALQSQSVQDTFLIWLATQFAFETWNMTAVILGEVFRTTDRLAAANAASRWRTAQQNKFGRRSGRMGDRADGC